MASNSHTPRGKFTRQRVAAQRRGVAWELTFDEWYGIWQDSGKWDLRGVGHGHYCMARHGDVGPYSVGNVSIQLSAVNSRDGVRAAHKSLVAADWHVGRGRGWTYVEGRSKPYQVMVAKKYIGSFATQEQAEAAYVAGVAAHGSASTNASMVFRSPEKSFANPCEAFKQLRRAS
jgi:hypothetical protein